MNYKHPALSPIALAAVCIFSMPACKDGGSDSATDGTSGSAGTDSTDSQPTGNTPTEATGDPTANPSQATDPTADPTANPSEATDPTADPTADPTGDPPDGPHALGTIFLGESHPAAGGKTAPSVFASFVPDAGTGPVKACTEMVAGCELAVFPDCGQCENDEYCGFDASCKSTCQPICDASCGADEVCYFPSPGTTGCKKTESFDAGALTFLGTPIPITLFPPYGFMSDDNASPFAPGGKATVQASGASNAGFEKFDREFTGSDFVQTNPKLDKLSFADVFGSGDLPIKWVPGTGTITIMATVTSADFKTGTITCKADDASGAFNVPRAGLKAAIDGGDIGGLSISVQRQRTDLFKDLTTKGQLTGVTVQPVGYLQVITSSTEYHAFQGCMPGEAVCNEACVDVEYDDKNCGGCDKACAGADACQAGTCNGPEACNACGTEASTGDCKAENDACAKNAACDKFEKCFTACQTQACADKCSEGITQATIDLYNAQIFCVCDEACVGECAGLCQ